MSRDTATAGRTFQPVVYNGEPLIRCPGCRTFVPIEPYVQLVGDCPVLDCPACRGARDIAFDRSLN